MQDWLTLDLHHAPDHEGAAGLLGGGQVGELRTDTRAWLIPDLESARVEAGDGASSLAEPLPTQHPGPAVVRAKAARQRQRAVLTRLKISIHTVIARGAPEPVNPSGHPL